MNADHSSSGWRLAAYSIFLGPVFLCLYLWRFRNTYPWLRLLALLPLILLLLCAWLSGSLTSNPNWIRLLYALLLAGCFAAVFIFHWTVVSVTKARQPAPRRSILLSRGIAWMTFMGIVFYGLSEGIQAVNYWLLGEYVMVYFSSMASGFNIWIPMGLIYGFVYGINANNQYFNRDLRGLAISLSMTLLMIAAGSLFILLLVIYPMQRLAPIAYRPQLADALFYGFTFFSMLLAVVFFLPGGVRHGSLKTAMTIVVATPLIMLHTVVATGYTTTLNLAVASIMEGSGRIDAAKSLYAKATPYIDHDPLLAALHHRQGVLDVLEGNYESAVNRFKKVIADYSQSFAVYAKASRYVESYRKNRERPAPDRTILPVKHRTFEQAASCFPNSLSVILSFYDDHRITTRDLSYAVKESFNDGTFIWKVEGFLDQRGYRLVTTFWETRQTLINLLTAGYPVLIYIPGHVYTLYGYDARMEIFFCYNTAKRNRWDDTPYFDFQREWMQSGFLMSVVVKTGEEEALEAAAPRIFNHAEAYQCYQRSMLSRYYARRDNYWPDGNRAQLSKNVGLDALKFNDNILLVNGFHNLPWNPEQWNREIRPLLDQPWSMQWSPVERHVLYLLFHHQTEAARRMLQQYQGRLDDDTFWNYDRLLEISLAAAVAAGDQAEVGSIADKLIGIVDNDDGGRYWGHYFKAKHLLAADDPARASQQLLPLLNRIDLDCTTTRKDIRGVVRLLADIQRREPSLIPADKARILDLYRIRFALDE